MGRVTDAHVSIPASGDGSCDQYLYFRKIMGIVAVMTTGITPPPLQSHAASQSQMVFGRVSGVELFRF